MRWVRQIGWSLASGAGLTLLAAYACLFYSAPETKKWGSGYRWPDVGTIRFSTQPGWLLVELSSPGMNKPDDLGGHCTWQNAWTGSLRELGKIAPDDLCDELDPSRLRWDVVHIQEVGFPKLCLRSVTAHAGAASKDELVRSGDFPIGKWPAERGMPSVGNPVWHDLGSFALPRRMLPLPTRPLWGGLLFNIAVYTSVSFAVIFALPAGLRWVKSQVLRGRDKCPKCAYRLEGLKDRVCPECGTNTPTKTTLHKHVV